MPTRPASQVGPLSCPLQTLATAPRAPPTAPPPPTGPCSGEALLDKPLGPWFPNLPPLASHLLPYHAQLSPGTAPPGNLTKFPFVLNVFYLLGPQSRLFWLASSTGSSLPTGWHSLSAD